MSSFHQLDDTFLCIRCIKVRLIFLMDTQCISYNAWSSLQFVTQVVDFLAFDNIKTMQYQSPSLMATLCNMISRYCMCLIISRYFQELF